jgi:eukaryotic-like serine/threonine-protein kinase
MLILPARYQPNGASDSGGFGNVIYCQDKHLDRPVAIKSIKDKSENHRLFDELKALMLLRSKHVVQVFDIVPGKNDTIGIVQEFIEGDDLWSSPIPNSSCENYIKTLWQIASGIADIHEAGVIHRDIKPKNMKFDIEGIVKIFDFGLSRDDDSKAVTLGYKGAPAFSAPELFNSGVVPFTKAIDTYAFGVTAIALSGSELPDELKNIPPHPIPSSSFSTLPIALPDELATLLTKCLSHDLKERPNMATVRDQLSRQLLRDKHQALAVYNNQTNVLNSSKRAASLRLPEIGEIKIEYDGFRFYVTSVSGEVFINNQAVISGEEIPGSCVVALGAAYRKNDRKYITFDVSNPEVVL